MNGLAIILIAIAVLLGGYVFYGRWLVKKWGIDPQEKTPAYAHEDGQDYAPAPKQIVFAHQFSTIAGAGPVTGPILAAMFGWVPALLWILIGGVFFGAVQDFGALYASVKNEGKSIGLIIEQYIGKTGKRLFLMFCWLFSLLVIAAFGDMVASTFSAAVADKSYSLGAAVTVSAATAPNAAAGSISLFYILGAVLFGLFLKYVKPNQIVTFLVGIALFVAMMAAGMVWPVYLNKIQWLLVVFAYIFFAAVVPMWILMQPRDYLSAFLLIFMILGAVVGIFVTQPDMNIQAFTSFNVKGSTLFPMLFVTIACGAVSGFHSLVSSGTSSKQIQNEKDMLPVGYGAMVVESLLAVAALVVAGAAAKNGKLPDGTPFQIFSAGVAGFFQKFGMSEYVAKCSMTMCVSALCLTTLDSVARIGRMSMQELLYDEDGKAHTPLTKFLTNKYVATVITLALGFVLAFGGYNNIWALFGSTNQLLAALVLIALAVFLKTTGREGWMLYVPMTVMLVVTMTALVMAVVNIFVKMGAGKFEFLTDGLQLIVAVLLMALAVMVAYHCLRKLVEKPEVQKTTVVTGETQTE
ncbi:MAG: Carbon starvation protein A [Thermocaproicibacter melissae]|jgi:carbon starvation protein|uniref:carbon starvation CstA family protein n=1 Tax=Thermocaproicibacter melissae TaxID=2966552 RepID=UPI0024B1C434|nr:carbon starvation protein A [Thermocaproicibacter melissae]WBY63766.1 carbon starvation protein A [Thermocaproicibacter melissae]